eukprot:TRINITY_DN649_c0_g2_i1.p1 TRINITY_DN649_c0_g2~~TRINITY_DN649_c0_g2_i1.p1  ORF type:complete len:546 (+),score=92.08 TRINITY_DN649_c0_g2_i1:432-2069(+)
MELINFITLRKAIELKHPHPLTAVIDKRSYLRKIHTSSVLPLSDRQFICNNCQSTVHDGGLVSSTAYLCEFCGDYVLCATCYLGFNSLASPLIDTPHHPFPLIDPTKTQQRFTSYDVSTTYTCHLCSKDCTNNAYRCVECDDYAECGACISPSKPATFDVQSPICLEAKYLTPVLRIDKNTFTLNEARLHKCPRAASIISNRPWDLSTIDDAPASHAYFEVTFNKLNDKEGKVSVGIGNQIFVQNQMLGYQQNSFGYCCDGLVSQNTKHNVQQFPAYTEGDTIGTGILLDSYNQRRIFFTRNGQFVGTYMERIHEGMDCFPGVSFMKGSEVAFVVNMTGPFKFDTNSIPNYRQDTTAYLSLLPPEVTLNSLLLASHSSRQTLELRLVNKQFSNLALENSIWKSLYFTFFPNQNRNLKVKSWYTMFMRRYKTLPYKAVLDRQSSEGGIENCAMEFECPLMWDNLTPTFGSQTTRSCNKCHKTVYKVDNVKALKDHVEMGRCVSLQSPRWSGHLMGAYAPPTFNFIPAPFQVPEGCDLPLPDDDDDF